jgi:hypothetical protein
MQIEACGDEIIIDLSLLNTAGWLNPRTSAIWKKTRPIPGTAGNLGLDIFDNIIEKNKYVANGEKMYANDIFAWKKIYLFGLN